MLRFLAFVANPAWESARAEMAHLCQLLGAWECSFRTSSLEVFHTGSTEVQILEEARGVILGKVFATKNAWGAYVAFEQEGRSVKVLRSPAGALACFYADLGNVRVFFSDVADYLALKSTPVAINWPWMATLLAYPRHAMGSPATGIVGIKQLQPGECLHCDPCGTVRRHLIWNPFQIATAEPIEDFASATSAVRTAVETVVWSWAARYPRIILLLSGGLDSSILLNCLRDAPTRPQVECLTYFSEACVTGDERAYARRAAQMAGVHLREAEERAADSSLALLLRMSKHPVPWSYLLYVRRSARDGLIASATGARAIFSGAAGDQIFFYGPALLAAQDYLRRYGVGAGFWSYALNVARRNKLSMWSVLAASARTRFTKPRYNPAGDIDSPSQLVTQEAFEEADDRADIRHYWMPYAEGVPHGKLLHVMLTDCPQDLRDPLGSGDYPERVQPLNSQPLIETCLRIPTYVLTHAGWSRAVARAAFAGDLPAQTVARVSKGYIDSQNADLLERNLPWARQLLLDGQLVSRGLLERRKLETLLRPETIRLSPQASEILCEHLSYEAWIHNWTSTISSSAATKSAARTDSR